MNFIDFPLCSCSWEIQSNVVVYLIFYQEEREVLALLSRLDLQNLEFTDSSPGMISTELFALHAWRLNLYHFSQVNYLLVLNKYWRLKQCHVIYFRKCRSISSPRGWRGTGGLSPSGRYGWYFCRNWTTFKASFQDAEGIWCIKI